MDINQYFPWESYREGQKEAIYKIIKAFSEENETVIFEGPTGSGKSVIGYTIAQMFDRVFWICPQKILQDQLMVDFGIPPKPLLKRMVDIKGRNNYPCTYWDTVKDRYPEGDIKRKTIEKRAKTNKKAKWVADPNLNCEIGVCKLRDNKSKCIECFDKETNMIYCPYWERVEEAKASPICLMNFKSFLMQTSMTTNFTNRDLLILDEAHSIEAELLDFVGITLDKKDLEPLKVPLKKFDTISEYKEFFKKVDLMGSIEKRIAFLMIKENIKEADEWRSLLTKLAIFNNHATDDTWIVKYKEEKKKKYVEFKPIFVDNFAHRYIWSKAKYHLLMSATIISPSIIKESLGLEDNKTYAYKMRNRFDIKNRPIYFQPSGSLSYRNKHKTYPHLIKDIDKICDNHRDEKGIIHTHNFEIAELAMEKCKKSVKDRLLFQKNFNNKKELLSEHSRSDNSIIIAPAMHEGLDLKYDLARFQIICKVPYQSFVNNPQLEARMKLSKSYYDYLTSLKLIQSYGRIVRSETDWGITYILDQDFQRFKNMASHMLPEWFKDAIIEN